MEREHAQSVTNAESKWLVVCAKLFSFDNAGYVLCTSFQQSVCCGLTSGEPALDRDMMSANEDLFPGDAAKASVDVEDFQAAKVSGSP